MSKAVLILLAKLLEHLQHNALIEIELPECELLDTDLLQRFSFEIVQPPNRLVFEIRMQLRPKDEAMQVEVLEPEVKLIDMKENK